jgi:hypothetical protein
MALEVFLVCPRYFFLLFFKSSGCSKSHMFVAGVWAGGGFWGSGISGAAALKSEGRCTEKTKRAGAGKLILFCWPPWWGLVIPCPFMVYAVL